MPKLYLSLAFKALSNLFYKPALFHLLDPLPSKPSRLPCTQSYRTHAAHIGYVLDPFPGPSVSSMVMPRHLCFQTSMHLHPPSNPAFHYALNPS